MFFKKRYALKGITKIVEGLPATPKYQKLKFFDKEAAEIAAIYREKSLFIKFDDRSFLPLNLYGLVNGEQLIAELKAKLNHVIDKSYEFTPQEARLLNKHEANYLIKMGNGGRI